MEDENKYNDIQNSYMLAVKAIKSKASGTILEEAEALVNGERQKQYGPPNESFTRIAKLWSSVLDCQVTPEQVAICMVLLKVSRQVNNPKRDNLVDAAGYLRAIEMLGNEINGIK
jgi:hypothetical protein